MDIFFVLIYLNYIRKLFRWIWQKTWWWNSWRIVTKLIKNNRIFENSSIFRFAVSESIYMQSSNWHYTYGRPFFLVFFSNANILVIFLKKTVEIPTEIPIIKKLWRKGFNSLQFISFSILETSFWDNLIKIEKILHLIFLLALIGLIYGNMYADW